jgi:Putative glycosyl/glycerophosphate transferases involved in teichoic acid biosynthesis TagF/TagB/EpsJ/RodC
MAKERDYINSTTVDDWVVFTDNKTSISSAELSSIVKQASKSTSYSLFVSGESSRDYLIQRILDWLRFPSLHKPILKDNWRTDLATSNPAFVVAHKSLVKKTNLDSCDSSISSIFCDLLSKESTFSEISSKLFFNNKANLLDKSWYFTFNKQWLDILSNIENLSEFNQTIVQKLYLSDLVQRLKINTNSHSQLSLSPEETSQFWKDSRKNLTNIPDELIMELANNLKLSVGKNIITHILSVKGTKLKKHISDNDITFCTSSDLVVYSANDTPVNIDMIDFDKKSEVLTVYGSTPFPVDDDIKLTANYHEEVISLDEAHSFSEYTIFNEIVNTSMTFILTIKPKPNTTLSFHITDKKTGTDVNVPLNFRKPTARMSVYLRYWRFGNFIMSRTDKKIRIAKHNVIRHILRELSCLTRLFFNFGRTRTKAFFLRLAYWLSKPFYANRAIWIFEDKIYKADDNGEALYRYAAQQDDNIEKYYVLRESSADVKKFENDGLGYLKFGSFKHKMLFLNASIVFGTHSTIPFHNCFYENNEMFRNLFNHDVLFIQHGLTVQRLPWLLSKSVDNSKLYFVTSKFETENLLQPEYGFQPHEIVTTGLPRFDYLKNNDQKTILITPTWRSYLAIPAIHGKSRGKNDLFKNSDYFKLYNSLINNKKLINTAKKCGYKITYLLHPVTSSQIDDYDINKHVKILTADNINYKEMLSDSSLMVTDYSGVQFDFAYMYKPVVYFHPPELPPSYDEAVYKYSEHALGDITTKSDELVDTICDYMKRDCKLKPKYKKRIDEFFYHHDYNNCKRIYDRAIEWQNGKG